MINVLLLTDCSVRENYVFTGKRATLHAEAKFIELCKSVAINFRDCSSKDIEGYLDDGFFEAGVATVVISHPIVNQDVTE